MGPVRPESPASCRGFSSFDRRLAVKPTRENTGHGEPTCWVKMFFATSRNIPKRNANERFRQFFCFETCYLFGTGDRLWAYALPFPRVQSVTTTHGSDLSGGVDVRECGDGGRDRA